MIQSNRLSRFHDWYSHFTNHEGTEIHEFTNEKINFHESRTKSISRIHDAKLLIPRFHETKKSSSRLQDEGRGMEE